MGKAPAHIDITAMRHTDIVYQSAEELRAEFRKALEAEGVPRARFFQNSRGSPVPSSRFCDSQVALGTGVNFARGWAPNLKFGRMSMIALAINGKSYNVDVESNTPLLWVLRDTIGLTGTKYGCGIALCGACTVHIDGVATRSCQVPVGTVGSKNVTTIEALAENGKLHPVQKAWLDLDVPQCGYCQSGMIMAAVSLLKQKPKPTDADIDAAMTNICRCGTYQRIRAAIHAAADNA